MDDDCFVIDDMLFDDGRPRKEEGEFTPKIFGRRWWCGVFSTAAVVFTRSFLFWWQAQCSRIRKIEKERNRSDEAVREVRGGGVNRELAVATDRRPT